MATLRDHIRDLIDRLEPTVERAFLKAIEDIKSEIVLREIVDLLERRDIEGAIRAMHIDSAAFAPLNEALRAAFDQGGALVIDNLPRLTDPLGGRVVIRWDVRNQGAEAVIRDLSSNLITSATEQTKQAVRETIVARYAEGAGPSAIGLDLVGRKSITTGQRSGGVIGLNAQQAALIERQRIALSSGDPALMRGYFDLKTRDKRLDRIVQRAIAEGKTVSAENLAKVLGRLRDNNLKLRGNTIARTETGMSVQAAKHEAYRQALDKAGRDESLVTRRWRTAKDTRVRDTHMMMEAQEVTGMDAPFVSPSGAMMRFPGDSSMGAGAHDVVNCRCDVEYNFNFATAYALSRGLR